MAAVLLLLPAGPALADGIRTGTNLYWRGDYRAAAAVLKPMAEEGHVLAQFAVAVMYDDGRGLPQGRRVGAVAEDIADAMQTALNADRGDCAAYGARYSWERSCDEFLAGLVEVDGPLVGLAA